MPSNHNGLKLEIITEIWEVHKYVEVNTLINNQCVKKRNHKGNWEILWDEWKEK